MKKLAAVVCALVLLFSASVSMADASEKEILFRGFPWGSSYTEFVEVLPESESRSLEGTIWGWAFDYRMLGIPPTDGCDDIGFYVKTGLPCGQCGSGSSRACAAICAAVVWSKMSPAFTAIRHAVLATTAFIMSKG